ncbi:TldD/PmbA family protein [Carboxydothermus ferrireducens]|uniref:TldD protein n=1 Tax=Carboxydothermus ferrireducens DSM 11255 TaxID=1119529 RepID=A0ABX2R9H0_9THEO|nr:TldD/PmbA family protein [Carboxydothermus ferrireducens]NYE56515.1 TldD protein [Carboxydothermus ferrireducens DSM 11255]
MDNFTINEVLREAAQRGAPFAEIYFEEKNNFGLVLEDGKIEKVTQGVEAGAGIRVIDANGRTTYAYTNDLSLEALLKAVRVATLGLNGLKDSVSLENPEVTSGNVQIKPGEVAAEEKLNLLKVADEEIRRLGPEIRQVQASYGELEAKVVIANTEGTYVEMNKTRVRFAVQAVAEKDGVIQTGYDAIGTTKGFETFKEQQVDVAARAAGERAIKMLSAEPAPSGEMPVVMAGEAGGTMIHEASGHGLEADIVQKRMSVYAGKKGQKVASSLITVVDDGTIPGKYGTVPYDDEGNKTKKNVLIDRGILTGYMYDRLTAKKDNVEPTGNGRRESYQHKPIPRMTNTYIVPGEDDPEKIIREVKEGLLVKKMGGGQVDTNTGDFVFEVSEGYLIEDGQVTVPVRGATLTGNGPEVLNNVLAVGKDLGWSIGTCGKDGQGVPVSDAQPTLLIGNLVVGGTGRIRRK